MIEYQFPQTKANVLINDSIIINYDLEKSFFNRLLSIKTQKIEIDKIIAVYNEKPDNENVYGLIDIRVVKNVFPGDHLLFSYTKKELNTAISLVEQLNKLVKEIKNDNTKIK